MRTYTLLCLFVVLVFGCSNNPVTPGASVNPTGNDGDLQTTVGRESEWHNPHKLWAAGNLFFDADHEIVELVPFRMGGIHLNVLKFFEESCNDCVLITGAHDNGDGTIDLNMEITHPFPGHTELTVFDPKLILMFQGSHVIPDNMSKLPLYPQDYHLSWRMMGDPEVLNPDGYTYLWSPWYDTGSTLPIFSYWEGKYAFGGVPTANINAYLDFYSNEDRHMLESGASAERTFHLSLPSGPIVAGYALDVCWEPPTVMPVNNPADDFPITANQPEYYHFNVEYNNGDVITDKYCCCWMTHSIEEGRVELYAWYELDGAGTNPLVGLWCEQFQIQKIGYGSDECNSPDPKHLRCPHSFPAQLQPDGFYQLICWGSWYPSTGGKNPCPNYDVVEMTIDLE